jgi:hypothetical protein
MWSWDARLGHPENLADLPQGQVLVVVERDHELLPLGEAGNLVGDPVPHLGRVEHTGRVGVRSGPGSC